MQQIILIIKINNEPGWTGGSIYRYEWRLKSRSSRAELGSNIYWCVQELNGTWDRLDQCTAHTDRYSNRGQGWAWCYYWALVWLNCSFHWSMWTLSMWWARMGWCVASIGLHRRWGCYQCVCKLMLVIYWAGPNTGWHTQGSCMGHLWQSFFENLPIPHNRITGLRTTFTVKITASWCACFTTGFLQLHRPVQPMGCPDVHGEHDKKLIESCRGHLGPWRTE